MSTPRATVRLQLHEGFTFDDAAATVDYYAKLGISHFYVSPNTAHEWQSWRRSLREIAPLLFKN